MTDEQARRLGGLVKRARLARKISLRRVERETRISYRWLARLEDGEVRTPPASKIGKLADLLDLPTDRIDRIMGGQFSTHLPTMHTYLRAKFQLTNEEIERIEAVFDQIRRDRRDRPGGELPD